MFKSPTKKKKGNKNTYGVYPCKAFAAFAAAAIGDGSLAKAAAAAAAAGNAVLARPLCIATPRNAAAVAVVIRACVKNRKEKKYACG